MHNWFHVSFSAARYRSPLLAVAAAAALGCPSAAQNRDLGRPEMEAWALQRMPAVMTGLASSLLETNILLADQLDLAMAILEVAVELDPDFLPAWEKQVQVGTAVLDDLEHAEVYATRAIDQVVRLDPGNQVARFRQILGRIDARSTAEGRLEAFEAFLTPRAVDALGPAIAARLSFDKALLHQRMGDTQAYARALAFAVELDPSFPAATATAAGFFRVAAASPAAEVELLIAAVSADPLNGALMRTLGQLLLGQGAYRGAAEVLPLALERTPVRSLPRSAMVEDATLALWGNAEPGKALEILKAEQRIRSSMLLAKRQQEDPFTDRHEFLASDPPPNPKFAILKAFILADQSDPTVGVAFGLSLEQAFEFTKKEMANDLVVARSSGEPRQLAGVEFAIQALKADEAWARLALNLERTSVPDLIDQALSEKTIDATKADVLRGWLAYRNGQLEDARATLEPLGELSAYARAGVAMVDRAEGDERSAAKTFLELYRTAPGTTLGLWARGELSRLLGRPIAPLERGRTLSRLAATLPHSVNRIIKTPASTLSSSLSASKNPMNFDDPFTVTVTLRNTSGIPLAIGAGCPIAPTFAIVPELVVAGAPSLQVNSLIYSAERTLLIPANGEVRYDLNLSATDFGLTLDSIAIAGATIKLRSVFNYLVVETNITLDTLGEQTISVPIRINGAMVGDDTIAQLVGLIKSIEDDTIPTALVDVAILSQFLVITSAWMDEYREHVASLVVEQFREAGLNGKAWLLAQIPATEEGLKRVVDSAVETDDPAVFAVLLIRWTTDPGDAAIVMGRKNASPFIQRMAKSAQETTELLEILRRRAFDLGDE
jgi:tetratricopeptide (TPR) repeat protein